MTATGPARFRYELPPASTSSTFELTGGDDWLGPITDRTSVDRPTLAGIKLRVREPGAAYDGFRTVEDTRQHLIFLPDTEVELTLVGSEPIADLRLDVHPGSISRARAARRPDVRRPLDAHRGDDAGDPANLRADRPDVEAGVPLDRPDAGPRASREPAGHRRRQPRHAGRHDPADAWPRPTTSAWRRSGFSSIGPPRQGGRGARARRRRPAGRRSRSPWPRARGAAVLDHQARHDVDFQADPPEVGHDPQVRRARPRTAAPEGAQTGRSGVLQFQVVSPDELFYEILIRQRAERAKFLAALEAAEAQGPILASDADARRVPRRDARPAHRAPASSTRSPGGSPTRSRR